MDNRRTPNNRVSNNRPISGSYGDRGRTVEDYSRYSRQGDRYAQDAQANAYRRDSQRYSHEQQAAAKSSRPLWVMIVIAVIVAAAIALVGVNLVVQSSKTTGEIENSGGTPTLDMSEVTKASQVNSAEAEASIVLTLFGDHDTYVLAGETYLEPGSHAVENKSTDISSSIVVEGAVDASTPGDYTVTYTATGSTGLQVQRTRTVHVVASMDKDTDGVPVLMYHYVYTAEDVPDDVNANWILDTDLADQLNYLVTNGYYFPSYRELRGYIDGTHSLPANSIVLTFDDGSPNFLAYGIPMLEKYKVPATSFIVGVDNIEPCTSCPSEYVTYQSHSYDMHRAGGTYGHGGRIGAMSEAEIAADLRANIALLGSSDAFAYPYGDAPSDGIAAVKEVGILCAFTTDYGKVEVGDDYADLTRIRVQGQNSLSSFIASIE